MGEESRLIKIPLKVLNNIGIGNEFRLCDGVRLYMFVINWLVFVNRAFIDAISQHKQNEYFDNSKLGYSIGKGR